MSFFDAFTWQVRDVVLSPQSRRNSNILKAVHIDHAERPAGPRGGLNIFATSFNELPQLRSLLNNIIKGLSVGAVASVHELKNTIVTAFNSKPQARIQTLACRDIQAFKNVLIEVGQTNSEAMQHLKVPFAIVKRERAPLQKIQKFLCQLVEVHVFGFEMLFIHRIELPLKFRNLVQLPPHSNRLFIHCQKPPPGFHHLSAFLDLIRPIVSLLNPTAHFVRQIDFRHVPVELRSLGDPGPKRRAQPERYCGFVALRVREALSARFHVCDMHLAHDGGQSRVGELTATLYPEDKRIVLFFWQCRQKRDQSICERNAVRTPGRRDFGELTAGLNRPESAFQVKFVPGRKAHGSRACSCQGLEFQRSRAAAPAGPNGFKPPRRVTELQHRIVPPPGQFRRSR